MIQLFVLRLVFGLFMEVMPDKLQEGISNAASNLSEPITVGSSLLQGDTENAGAATKRFLINSTVGLGGLQDKATEMGIEARKEDLGQTMATHGVGLGFQLSCRCSGQATFVTRPVILPHRPPILCRWRSARAKVWSGTPTIKRKSNRSAKTRSMDTSLSARPIKVTARHKSVTVPRFQGR